MKFKNYFYLPLTLLLTFSLAACDLQSNMTDPEVNQEVFERRELPRSLSESEAQIVDGTGYFGFNLMHELIAGTPDGNHFISPLSIIMAYGMAMNGAEDETYSQMQDVFGLTDLTREETNQAALDLIELLTTFDEEVQFNIANSIWIKDTFDVDSDFIDNNQHYFKALVEKSDFSDPVTVDLINQWVSENTNGLIDEITEAPIDPLTVMFLINAIYFNGEWTFQFDPDHTEIKPFHPSEGTPIDVEMMRLDGAENLQYTSGDDYQAINLFYGDAGFTMTLVLPDEDTNLDSWLQNISWEDWKTITGSFSYTPINLDMPKFELEYEIDGFKEILQAMGITDAFDPANSDFSRINSMYDDLYISDTKHKSFIRVDEEGTEAAAVTSIEMGVTSAPQTINLRFDRPYFYVIREVESNTILFMGTMANPSGFD
jgi:serine protease inhibitor